MLVFQIRNKTGVAFDVHDEYPLAGIRPLIGMFDGIQLSAVGNVVDNFLKRDTTFLP